MELERQDRPVEGTAEAAVLVINKSPVKQKTKLFKIEEDSSESRKTPQGSDVTPHGSDFEWLV